MVVERLCRLSIHIYDQRDGAHYKSHGLLPEAYYGFFADVKTYIGRGELAIAIASFFSKPKLFEGRKVIHFIDNAPALSNLVNGYSGKADVAQLVNMFHVAMLALDVEWYGEWVPSKANIADIMTREERFHELLAGLGAEACENLHNFELKLPPLGESWEDLRAWMAQMRARAGEMQ